MRRSAAIAIGVALLVPVSLAAAIAHGSVDLSIAEIARALFHKTPIVQRQIVWGLRMPRVASAFACGGLLAVAGALLQALLRNPLADPYVLGVSGGAAVGALAAMTIGASGLGIESAALAGAGAVIALVFAANARAGGWNVERLLLSGVILSSGLAAIVSLFLVLAPAAQLHGMLFWLMGDLSRSDRLALPLCMLALIAVAALVLGGPLNVLSLGELKAKTLGLNVGKVQALSYAAAAAATAAAVVTAGGIGFIGLIVPHAIRLAGVADYRGLLPLALLLGGSLLTLADLAARTIAAPIQLPVGALTALVGVPALLVMLLRRS